MNKDVKAKWLEALRSGEYEQGRSYLRSDDNKFCCLGVLCEIAVQDGVIDEASLSKYGTYRYDGWYESALPEKVQDWSGVDSTLGRFADAAGSRDGALAFINDDGATFDEIADIIESEF